MGVKLMTGATGEQNIQAADDRECLAGITGLDSYVFPTGNQLKATLVDANTVTIGTGAGSLQGSRFRCSTTTAVNIQSGTQGQFRHDIIGLHFSRETSGREGLEFQVLTGKPAASTGAAKDPTYKAGDLLKGDAAAFMPLYRVKLSGINAADPEPMFSVLTPLATLGDSVSRVLARPGIKLNGTVVIPGLKGRATVTVAFGHGAYGVMPTSDGTHVVAGAAGGDGYSVASARAKATVSGEQVTFKDAVFAIYSTPGLGSALTLSAGDSETIDVIYG